MTLPTISSATPPKTPSDTQSLLQASRKALPYGYLEAVEESQEPDKPLSSFEPLLHKAAPRSPVKRLLESRLSAHPSSPWELRDEQVTELQAVLETQRLGRAADREQCQLAGSLVAALSAMEDDGKYSITSGFGPSLNMTESAIAKVKLLNQVSKAVIKHARSGGDYLLIKPSTRRRPFLHQLGVGLLLAAVQGSDSALVITITLGKGPGIMVVFLDDQITIPQALQDHEADLNKAWSYFKAEDPSNARSRIASKHTPEAVTALEKLWAMVDGEVGINDDSMRIASGSSDTSKLPPITASVLLEEGRSAFHKLLKAQADTDVTVFFAALYDGTPVDAEIRLRAHSDSSDQHRTRTSWTGTEATITELNPQRSRYLDVNAALVSCRPRNWGTLCDMLLMGSDVHSLSTGIFVRRSGKPTLALHYGTAFRGAPVSPNVFAAVSEAFAPGNSMRFGLRLASSSSLTAPTQAKPQSVLFPKWALSAVPSPRNSSSRTYYPWFASIIEREPLLYSTPQVRKQTAKFFAAEKGVFYCSEAAAEAFLADLAKNNKPSVKAANEDLKEQAKLQQNSVWKPLMKGGMRALKKPKQKQLTGADLLWEQYNKRPKK